MGTWEREDKVLCKDLIKDFEDKAATQNEQKESNNDGNSSGKTIGENEKIDDNNGRRSTRRSLNVEPSDKNTLNRKPGPKRKTCSVQKTPNETEKNKEVVNNITRIKLTKDSKSEEGSKDNVVKEVARDENVATEEDFNALFTDAPKKKASQDDSVIIEESATVMKDAPVEVISLDESKANETITLDETKESVAIIEDAIETETLLVQR